MSLVSIATGFAALRSYPLRSMLATLGIVIGVASLVAVLALGDGIERFARDQIERTTSLQSIVLNPQVVDVIDGQRFPRSDILRLTEADADSVQRLLGPGAEVTLLLNGAGLLDSAGAKGRRVTEVVGTIPETARMLRLRYGAAAPFLAGRFFSSEESHAGVPVAVISYRLAHDLAGDSAAALLGKPLRVQGTALRIVGILAAYKDEQGRSVYVPVQVAPALMPATTVAQVPDLVVRAVRVEDVEPLRQRLVAWLDGRDRTWRQRAELVTGGARLRQAQQGMLIFKLFMGAITGISLLVGGIGIMNVLLASVVERTREVGIRRAAGAKRRDILVQFLAESVAMTGIGSIVGAALGFAGAFGVTAIIRAQSEAHIYAGFSWSTLLIAALASASVGLVFGSYPALRAARLSPIDAIRHE